MLRLVMMVLAFVLSQGWQWSRLLQEQQQITADQGLLVAAAFTVLFLLQQLLLQVKQPAERSHVRDRSAVVEVFLKQMVAEYYAILSESSGKENDMPEVRCSVMLPVIDRFGFRRRLQICYRFCLKGVQYGAEEQDIYWTARNGLVGWVWSRGVSQVFSDPLLSVQSMARSMSQQQVAMMSHLRSLVCVPILLNGKSIAVLTLDSYEDLSRTQFDCARVQDLLHGFAAKLPAHCFAAGVKPR